MINVYYMDEKVGVLNYKNKKYTFQYDQEYLKNNDYNIAANLPLEDKLFVEDKLFSIFRDVLPRQDEIVQQMMKEHNVEKEMDLLPILFTKPILKPLNFRLD